MRLEDVPRAFEAAVHRSGRVGTDLDAAALLRTMADWYRTERCSDAAPIESDGDMLLAQWGRWRFLAPDDDDAADPPFGLDITRQIVGHGEDDEGIWQLSVTLVYEASHATHGSTNRWCADPSEIDDFISWVEAQPAFAAVAEQPPARVEISWGVAG